MDLDKPQTIEEVVLRALGEKALTGEALLGICQPIKKGFTKQALYQLLRKLIDREIVIKHGKQFSLSRIWILKMNDFFSLAQNQYGIGERGGNNFLALSDGDKVAYSFKSPVEADRFWGHAFNILGGLLAGKEPLYIYNPHEWFFFARKESEEFLFKELQTRNQKVWLLCGGKTLLDKYTAKYFDGSVLQYYMASDKIFEARNYYLNIFGEYIIEARIDENIAEKIDQFYEAHTTVTKETVGLLTKLLEQGKTTITISRNKKKSEKLKKIFAPYFY
jgi:hypothetical protein